MKHIHVALLGFGNVGRALAQLLIEKQASLQADLGVNVRVVGISTGRHGSAIDPNGIFLRTALDAVRFGSPLTGLHNAGNPIETTEEFLEHVPADLIFETIPTNPEDGEPALSLVRSILERGQHVVTANKGPVAFGYKELTAIAEANEVGFFFESSLMDGAPVLNIAREGLPGAYIREIRGIFNSTTNYILTRMEQDKLNFAAALKAAQDIGIAETDPTLDIDGWDAAIKTVIAANVFMGADLRPQDVERVGIRELTLADVQAAEKEGQRIRLVCEATRDEDDRVQAKVGPAQVPIGETFAGITGTTSIIEIESDTLPGLSIIEKDPGPRTTAYGMFADMLNILRNRHQQRIGGDQAAVTVE